MKFHKTSLRLAGLYLAILMTISLFFSLTLYNTSMNELERGLRRPTQAFNSPIVPGFSADIRQQLLAERQDQYDQARDHIVGQLVMINIAILVGGGLLCYYLALRTLKPIEEAHEAQSRFTADASHELRTPITAMRSENEVALMDPKLSLATAKKQLQSNIEELEKLTNLSDGLLRLAQVENNHLIKSPVELQGLIDNAISRVLPHAEKKHMLVESKIKTKSKVSGDEASLIEALVTILDNAVKYSPDKSTVHIDVKDAHHGVTIAIKDTGIGIKASEVAHIFDRFYRADTSRTKQNVEGYGLGLALAKSIIEAHSGKITVDSKPGVGSTFTLTLPALSETTQ